MEQTFLIALFFFQGEWTMLQGYHPLAMPSQEVCKERKEFMEGYLSQQKLPEYHLVCLDVLPEIGGQMVQEYIDNNLPDV